MPIDQIHVPVDLLTCPGLSATAKLAWMVARLRALGPGSPAPVPLSRPTMRKGLAQLASAGWDPDSSDDRGATVSVPAALVTNSRLGIEARVLYGLLLLTPGFQHPCGQFTYAQLAEMAHASRNTVAQAVQELAGAEWIRPERAHRKVPVRFQLTLPGLDRQSAVLAEVQKRLERMDFRGEQLMREFLSLLVDSAEFEDEAAPWFLVNPRTGERLRFDRFYPPVVAWEFNGPQHYHKTQRFTAEEVARQQERDLIKLGICAQRGITVVVVKPEDLTLAGMQAKVGYSLPLRDTSGLGPVLDYLEMQSQDYARRVQRLYRT